MSERKNIISAIAAAKGDVKRVAKDGKNVEQKYAFASIDDFMAMVGPVTAKHGLVTLIDEDDREFIEKPGKYGPTFYVAIRYRITTYHASGEEMPAVTRNIEVIRNGPQAYGAAQSYILKQYYRGLLDIPTGDDDDPDNGKVQEESAGRHQQRGPSDADIARDRAVTDACVTIASAETMADLQATFTALPTAVKADQRVIAAKDERKAALAKHAAPPIDDEIPYN